MATYGRSPYIATLLSIKIGNQHKADFLSKSGNGKYVTSLYTD